jgi:succinate-semialdehyde dehydrogenase/glutarate-semialdehyde dehydrogenase
VNIDDKQLLKSAAYIDGEWFASSELRFDVSDPATGDVIANVPDLGAVETELAIAAAEKALPAWRQRPAKERAAILRVWYDLILAHKEDLARIMTAEQGKPLAESRGEIAYGASFIEWFAEEAKRVYGDVIPSGATDKRIIVIKQPIGVVAAITPWNFPSAMITRKAAPALAAGCTIVIKPASETPLSALALAELGHRAGIPRGVLNVVTGRRSSEIGSALTSSKIVRKLSFTGSTAIGKLLMEQCASTVKRVSLELGGNAPFIVFDDADLDAAVAGAIASKYRNAGQTCVCVNRILVQDTIHDAFAEKLAVAVRQLKIGPGNADGVTVGPLIHDRACADVAGLVDRAIEGGAKLMLGGKVHGLGGSFYEPTILTDVKNGMEIAQQEIFGPVAPLIRFDTEQDVIAIANDTPYGLASYLYSRDIGRIWRVAEQLEYGMVGINDGILSTEVAPFGGVKESGIGREGSRYGIEDYLEIKYLLMSGLGA